MKQYGQYKDSGVKWLGEIPNHWEVRKLKYLTSYMQSGTNLTAIQIKDQGKFPVYGGNGRRGFYDEANWMKSCIVIGRQGALCGNVHIVKEPFWATDHAVITMNNKTTNIDYLFYLALTMNFNQYASQTAAQPGIAVGFIKNVSTCLPSLSEQHAIATYLDKKVNKIDSYIATAEKKIAALDELKQVTIANAVTHGIHPNVPMKDSGIRWVGQVPEHWEISKIRSLLSLSKEKTQNPDAILLSLSQYTGVRLKKDCNKTGMFEAENTIGYNIVHRGQFVMNIMLAWNGSYAISEYDGVISPAYCVFNFIRNCNRKYFDYLLRLKSYAGAFKTLSKGLIDSRLRLYPDYFKIFPIPIPPLSEQEEIVSYIDRKVAQIDKLRNTELAQIEKLKEYKQCLISDVVTGKIKV